MLDLFARLATERTRRILIIAGVVFLLAAAIGAPVVTILKSESSDFQDPHAQNQQVLRRSNTPPGRPPPTGWRRSCRARPTFAAIQPPRRRPRTWSRCCPGSPASSARSTIRRRICRCSSRATVTRRSCSPRSPTANARPKRSSTSARSSPAQASASAATTSPSRKSTSAPPPTSRAPRRSRSRSSCCSPSGSSAA